MIAFPTPKSRPRVGRYVSLGDIEDVKRVVYEKVGVGAQRRFGDYRVKVGVVYLEIHTSKLNSTPFCESHISASFPQYILQQ